MSNYMRKIILVLGLFICNGAIASDKIVGKWQGNIIVGEDKPMFVFLDISSLTPGKNVLTLKYGQPINCSLLAEYGGPVNETKVFYFTRGFQTGNWCYKNILIKKSEIRISITGSGKLSYSITSKGSNFQSAILHRSD